MMQELGYFKMWFLPNWSSIIRFYALSNLIIPYPICAQDDIVQPSEIVPNAGLIGQAGFQLQRFLSSHNQSSRVHPFDGGIGSPNTYFLSVTPSSSERTSPVRKTHQILLKHLILLLALTLHYLDFISLLSLGLRKGLFLNYLVLFMWIILQFLMFTKGMLQMIGPSKGEI